MNERKERETIIYVDLDNFKAFNDDYGFALGDKVILSAASAMRSTFPDAFIGHVGGDDFVLVSAEENAEERCRTMCGTFRRLVLPLYTENDRKRGYIISHDRSGFEKEFPIITLSAALIDLSKVKEISMEDLSILVAKTKKEAEKIEGDAIVSA